MAEPILHVVVVAEPLHNPATVTEEGARFIQEVCSPGHELEWHEYQRASKMIAALYKHNRSFGAPDGSHFEESNLPVPFEGDSCLVKLNDSEIVGAIYLDFGLMQLDNGLVLSSKGPRRWVSWGPA